MSDERFAEDLDPAAPPGSEAAARIRRRLGDEAMWEEPKSGLAEQLVSLIGQRASEEARLTLDPDPERPLLFRPAAIWIGSAAVLALIVLGAVLLLPRPDTEPPSREFSLQGTELAQEASADATIITTEAGFAIRLEVQGLPPAPAGAFYEGWVRGDRGSVSIGTFHMRGEAPIGLWSGVDPAQYPTLNITLQEEGAGPASSGQIVLTGLVPSD